MALRRELFFLLLMLWYWFRFGADEAFSGSSRDGFVSADVRMSPDNVTLSISTFDKDLSPFKVNFFLSSPRSDAENELLKLKDFRKLNVKTFFFSGSDYGILRTTLPDCVHNFIFIARSPCCYCGSSPRDAREWEKENFRISEKRLKCFEELFGSDGSVKAFGRRDAN